MTDPDILRHLRLSEGDAADFIQKLLAFYNSLNAEQRAAFLRYRFTEDVEEAARLIGAEVSPTDLRDFFEDRMGDLGPGFLAYIRRGRGDDDDVVELER